MPKGVLSLAGVVQVFLNGHGNTSYKEVKKKKGGGGGKRGGTVVFLDLFSASGFLIWLEKKTNNNKINYYRNAKQHNML